MMDINARKEWLQMAADKLKAIVDEYEFDPFTAGCDDFEELITRAYVISRRMQARAKMYDEPSIAQAQSDAELRMAAIDFVHSKMQSMKKSVDAAEKGEWMSQEEIENAHAWRGNHAELNFIFQITMEGGGDDA